MEQRAFRRINRNVSVIGAGTWQLGGDWGPVEAPDAMALLTAAVEAGVTFFDTADVYGDGRSEQLVGRFLRESGADVYVATKMGRRAPLDPGQYTLANFRSWIDRSRANLGVDRLDLIQLHCPPMAVYSTDAVYDALDTLIQEQRIAAYGVSVETCAEALIAIARPGVASVQIILNPFRQKPLDEVLPAAERAGVGIIARVPLASGLLSGKYTRATTFAPTDHRTYNRDGSAFDIGETFSGIDFETGVDAAAQFAELIPDGMSPAQAALRWILQQPGVSSVIPGARNADQMQANAAAAGLDQLPERVVTQIRELYSARIAPLVHDRW